jgi:hypothetical protein
VVIAAVFRHFEHSSLQSVLGSRAQSIAFQLGDLIRGDLHILQI